MREPGSTPKTLDEAIDDVMMVPLNKLRNQAHAVLKDFIAQKVQIASIRMEKGDPQQVLTELFKDLTKREES